MVESEMEGLEFLLEGLGASDGEEEATGVGE